MATHRAPKQWSLTKKETATSFENWKQNLLYTLKLDPSFASYVKDGAQWAKKAKSVPNRGFVDDGEEVMVAANRLTAVQKAATLEIMLGQIANYCPVISRNSIINSTCLPNIWQLIRLHYGLQSTRGHFLDLADIDMLPDDNPEDVYQRLMAFVEDNLLKKDGNITHHRETLDDDEELTPSLENLISLRWLTTLHCGLPKLVKQRYDTELSSQTLASIRPEISLAILSLLEELKCNTDNAHTFRTTTEPFQKSYEPRSKQKGDKFHNPRQTQWKKRKSCSICANTSCDDNHWLSECHYLSHADRQFMAKARQITQVFEAQGESDVNEDSDYEDSMSSARLVSVRQSPYFSTFCGYYTVDITVDTGATGNMIREDVVKKLGGKISKSTQVASQADGRSPLQITGETRLQFTRGEHSFLFEGLVVKDLDVDVLAGIPFMEYNDILVRPAVQKIYFSTGSSCSYGKTTSNPTHKVRRAHILRAPNKLTTVFPGEFVEAPVPDEIVNISVTIEPRLDTHHPNWLYQSSPRA